MARTLVLLRHGEAEPKTDGTDSDRPLTPRGRSDAARMGRWLLASGLAPAVVVSSPAARARATAALACHEAGFPQDRIIFDDRAYLADMPTLLRIVEAHLPRQGALWLVGHNQGLEDLLQALVPGVPTPPDGKLLPTCAAAGVALPTGGDLLASGRLVRLQRPRDLAGE